MAKVTIHVRSFDYNFEGNAKNEDEVFDKIDYDELGSLALEFADITQAEFDEEEEDEEEK